MRWWDSCFSGSFPRNLVVVSIRESNMAHEAVRTIEVAGWAAFVWESEVIQEMGKKREARANLRSFSVLKDGLFILASK